MQGNSYSKASSDLQFLLYFQTSRTDNHCATICKCQSYFATVKKRLKLITHYINSSTYNHEISRPCFFT